MLYLYKILRITAWLLVIATVITLFSGFLAVKYFLLPGINYNNIHVAIIPWLFIPLFYIHSSLGLFNLLTRHKSTSKKWVKIICELIWLAVFILLIWVILAKAPIANINSPANNSSSNNPLNSTSVNLSVAEIAKHNSKSDCWMIINNKVYNLTNFINFHPGGAGVITPYCGKDGSIGFATKDRGQSHSSRADNLLNSYYLGDLNGNATVQQVQSIQNQPQPNTGNGESEFDD
jgi:cytochrome b involved in lipid metabolism